MSTAAAVLAGIRRLYPSPGWAVLPEVRTATGCSEGLRIADAIAVALWPSARGVRHGFEIKVSRNDFAAERKQPWKSAPFRSVCSAWWLAVPAPRKNVVPNPALVPQGWGLLEVGGGEAVVIVNAVEHEPAPLPEEMQLAFLRAAARAGELEESVRIPGVPSQLVTRPMLSRSLVGLACGHVVARPLTKTMPRRLPCFPCAEGKPSDRELVLEAIDDASAEDLHYFVEVLRGRGALPPNEEPSRPRARANG